MGCKTKADLVEMVTQNVRRKINLEDRNILKGDVRLVIDSTIEECRNLLINGDSLMLRGFMSISIEERSPRFVAHQFGDGSSQHLVGPMKAIKIVPCESFKKAIIGSHSVVKVKAEEEKISEEVLS